MPKWIADIGRHLDLGDSRRVDRVAYMTECIAAKPGLSIPQTFEEWDGVKGAYRALSNEHISAEAILAALQQDTLARVRNQAGRILVIQDTTSLDFSDHPATVGLGPTGGGDGCSGHGFFAHSALAVGSDGVPLGLLYQKTWVRDPAQVGKHHQRRQRLIEDKESYRWIEALQAVEAAIPAEVEVLNIGDREADIYELFAAQRPSHSHLLIRAAHDRCVRGEPRHLWAAVEAASEAGQHELLVRQHPTHAVRKATVTLRFCAVDVQPPQNGTSRADQQPVALTAILVREVGLPPESKHVPLQWLLLTDLPADDLAAALDLLRCYTLRWLIERYHYTLKSGCRIEDRQLRTDDRLLRLLAIYCIVAWRLLWLTYAARERGDEPCTVAFGDLEWQLMYRRYGSQATLPDRPPSLREATRWLARLGGFLNRKGDGEPGVKVLWRGIMRLHDMIAGYMLADPSLRDVGNA